MTTPRINAPAGFADALATDVELRTRRVSAERLAQSYRDKSRSAAKKLQRKNRQLSRKIDSRQNPPQYDPVSAEYQAMFR